MISAATRRGTLSGVHGVADPASSLRPPLKWPGGKRWQVPQLRLTWQAHQHRRLVEPFCGGLAVALGLQPQRALLNDSNRHLISFYRWLQRGLTIDVSLANSRAEYYRRRQEFNDLVSGRKATTKRAATLFYYLNRTGYNGLCRFNSRDQFNVPFGQYASIRYVRDFLAYAPVFSRWQFTSGDFEAVELASDDFVYADPPYDVEFTHYGKSAFSWDDQQRAARWLAAHPGPVVLVNQRTARVERLYRDLGFDLRFADGPRRISCTGDRTPAREIIATRNL